MPSLPVTPYPAVAGPFTGGQIWAQPPLQFDLVAVSGANQYRANRWPLVSTVTPLIFAVFNAVPDEAGLDAGAAALKGVLLAPPEPDDELPHAAASDPATTYTIGASHLACIGCLPSSGTARRVR